MTLQYVCGALTAALLTCGVSAVAPAYAQAPDATLLPPDQSGWVTVVGCLQPRGAHAHKYALASPMPPVASVIEDTCSAPVDSRAFELDDPEEAGITEALFGRWIEVYGKLEKETSTDPDNYRELDVKSFRVVPVIRPHAEVVPAPLPQFEQQSPPAARPEETPVATTGAEPPKKTGAELPKTASSLPAVGLLGLLSLAGALAVRRCLSPRPR
jgi:hypothetical protein